MRTLFGILALATATMSCGTDKPSKRSVTDSDCDQAKLPAPPPHGWWKASSDRCPPNTKFTRTRREFNVELSCLRDDLSGHGPWTLLRLDGSVERIGQYDDGLEHGIYEMWRDGKRFGSTPHCRGLRHGTAVSWHFRTEIKASQGDYLKNLKHGKWEYWHPNGTLMRVEHWRDGVQDGVFEAWSDAGESFGKGKIVAGTGTWVKWFDNGQEVVRGQLKAGKRVGVWRMWFENGQLANETTFVNDIPDGTSVSYFPDGARRSESEYRGGRQVGTSRRWNKDGELVDEQHFGNPE